MNGGGPILLTGASGYLGTHLLDAIVARGGDIVAVSRHEIGSPWHGVTHRVCDVLDANAVRNLICDVRPSVCVHAAWYVEHGRFWSAAENVEWVAATASLARAFADCGGRRFVGLGTQAEYASDLDQPAHEQRAECRPSTLYGSSKDATRRLLSAYFSGSGIAFVWARIFNVFGLAEPPGKLIPDLIRRLSRGERALMSSGSVVRDFIDVRDVAAAVAVLSLGPVDGTVNIGTGKPRAVVDVARELARQMGAIELLRAGELPDRAGEPRFLVADVGRLTGEVGFAPGYPLDVSLRDSIAYWTGSE